MRIAFGVEYCGREFYGWQRLKQGRSVQGCMESALSAVADHPVTTVCAGRTDRGVHARCQVIHIDTGARRDPYGWVLGCNARLPDDAAVLWARPVTDEFHARYSAIGRRYRYVILNRRARPGLLRGLVSWEGRPLAIEAMQEAALCLIGEHDFSGYRAQGCQSKSPVREVRRLDISRHGDFVVIEIEANAFVHHMVRNIAGVLTAIGIGKAPIGWTREILAARDRSIGGVTAPAAGLYLVGVSYPPGFGLPPAPDGGWPDLE